jgi:uncharacterized protein
MNEFKLPVFRPHPILRGGNLQTLAGVWFRDKKTRSEPVAELHRVILPDGDCLILHDDETPGWRWGDPVALFVHGLCGSADSPYLRRMAGRLREHGIRTFRMNLRGCGAGKGLARQPYHAGRSEDVDATVQAIRILCPGSPIHVAGVSLGGNIVLKWLSEQSLRANRTVATAIAVNPPIDLHSCSLSIQQVAYGLYDRYFSRMLCRHVRDCPELRVHNIWVDGVQPPRQMLEFDETFTAPRAGFHSALDYYTRCSSIHRLPEITVPTLILTSRDDPVVPVRIFEKLQLPACVQLHIVESGGHLGYVGRRGDDADGWWLDWRIVDWFTGWRNTSVPQREGWMKSA